MKLPFLSNPFWLVDQYKKDREARQSTQKNWVAAINGGLKLVNDWDFNRKSEVDLKKLQPTIAELLRTNNGVLVKIYSDIITGANDEQTRIYQGMDIVGAGSAPRMLTYAGNGSIHGSVCTPEQLAGRRFCKQGADFIWITLFGMQTVIA